LVLRLCADCLHKSRYNMVIAKWWRNSEVRKVTMDLAEIKAANRWVKLPAG